MATRNRSGFGVIDDKGTMHPAFATGGAQQQALSLFDSVLPGYSQSRVQSAQMPMYGATGGGVPPAQMPMYGAGLPNAPGLIQLLSASSMGGIGFNPSGFPGPMSFGVGPAMTNGPGADVRLLQKSQAQKPAGWEGMPSTQPDPAFMERLRMMTEAYMPRTYGDFNPPAAMPPVQQRMDSFLGNYYQQQATAGSGPYDQAGALSRFQSLAGPSIPAAPTPPPAGREYSGGSVLAYRPDGRAVLVSPQTADRARQEANPPPGLADRVRGVMGQERPENPVTNQMLLDAYRQDSPISALTGDIQGAYRPPTQSLRDSAIRMGVDPELPPDQIREQLRQGAIQREANRQNVPLGFPSAIGNLPPRERQDAIDSRRRSRGMSALTQETENGQRSKLPSVGPLTANENGEYPDRSESILVTMENNPDATVEDLIASGYSMAEIEKAAADEGGFSLFQFMQDHPILSVLLGGPVLGPYVGAAGSAGDIGVGPMSPKNKQERNTRRGAVGRLRQGISSQRESALAP